MRRAHRSCPVAASYARVVKSQFVPVAYPATKTLDPSGLETSALAKSSVPPKPGNTEAQRRRELDGISAAEPPAGREPVRMTAKPHHKETRRQASLMVVLPIPPRGRLSSARPSRSRDRWTGDPYYRGVSQNA